METIDVLLVEDSAADAELVADTLAFARAPRFVVTHASRLSEACEQLRARSFDVVVLDLGLPDGGGLSSLSTLRASAPGVAIVVLSGLRDERLALQAVQSGAQDFLVKRRDDGDALQRAIRYAIARRQADEAERRLAAIVESSTDAIIASDRGGTIVSWNPGAERLYGYAAADAIGRPVAIVVPAEAMGDHEAALARVLAGRPAESHEARHVRRDGTEVDVSLTVSGITDAGGAVVGVASIARDISERKRLERELQHRADHDHLTGLLNRRRFEQELAHQLALARRYGTGGALLSLDLDDFKAVNDTHGHAAGDALLRGVARALGERLRGTDILARLGGDELAILVPHAARADALALASGLLDAVRTFSVAVSGETVASTTSIGIALFTDAAESIDRLLARADRAMYAAKHAGGDRVMVAGERPAAEHCA